MARRLGCLGTCPPMGTPGAEVERRAAVAPAMAFRGSGAGARRRATRLPQRGPFGIPKVLKQNESFTTSLKNIQNGFFLADFS